MTFATYFIDEELIFLIYKDFFKIQKKKDGTSLAVQWLGFQTSTPRGAWVRSLVGDWDPACRAAWAKKPKNKQKDNPPPKKTEEKG